MSARRTWLAKVTSFAFPRTFSTGPLQTLSAVRSLIGDHQPDAADVNELVEAALRHHHVCFTVEITDGSKHAVGRQVEVQLPADHAMKLGQQMVRVATALLPAPREGEQNPPSERDEMT